MTDNNKMSTNYQDLMLYRIHEILLIASDYDSYILEEDGRLTEQILNEYIGMNLSYAPRLWKVSTAESAISILSERSFDLIIIMLRIYWESDAFNLKCIVSNVDGNKYCVRERAKLQLAADLLAKVTNKLKKLVEYMGENYPDRENVRRLKKGFNPKKINEILPTSSYTAYSENKGEKKAFCVTKQKKGNNIIKLNLLNIRGFAGISMFKKKTGLLKAGFYKEKFLLNF